MKAPFAIYLDLECLFKKSRENSNNNSNNNSDNNNNNNLEKLYTKKKNRHESSGWAMFTRCSFDKKENKLNYYREKDCIEKLCKKLKERAMRIIS